ncbi:MAG: Fe-S cluster assembly protein SufD [Bacteroidetes bacterium QH_6_63_17]|nr:MAG: Fe-S cluster assembly protein SufD [Bacteroidetes bacterium QH_6_63_17]
MTTALDTDVRPEDRFISAFKVNHGQALNGTNASIAQQREDAIERFAQLGIPDNDLEAWKYTNISKIIDRPYTLPLAPEPPSVAPGDIAPFLIDDLDAHRVVLVNGRVDESLSDIGVLPPGVVVSSLAQAGAEHPNVVEEHYGRYADAENEALTALNTAFVQDGAFVYVPSGTIVEKPIFFLHVTAGQEDLFLQPRHLFVVEDGAIARIIETQHSLTDAHTFTNTVGEAFVGERANLEHYLVQDEGPTASQVHTRAGQQKDDSVYTTDTVTFSGEVIRNNATIEADGSFCESNLYGLCIGKDDMHVDNHTRMDHVQPDCDSNELYKHVLNDESTAVFNGKVFVSRGSQRIDAYQQNDTIVLTDEANIYTKPELEIYADDVVCSHGATTGQVNEEGVFYLRSRGLSERRARILMLQAFTDEVLSEFKIDALRDYITDKIRRRFASYFE